MEKDYISLDDTQAYASSIFKCLAEKKVQKIVAFDLKALSSTQAVAKVYASLKNERRATFFFRVEKLEGGKIKVTPKVLQEDPFKNTVCTIGPFEAQSPKNHTKSFDPAVPILPSFWGGC